MNDDASENKDISFESAYKRLEEISRQLEDSNTPLEKSFELYEEGQTLVNLCQNMLDKAEKRLKTIHVNENGHRIEDRDVDG